MLSVYLFIYLFIYQTGYKPFTRNRKELQNDIKYKIVRDKN